MSVGGGGGEGFFFFCNNPCYGTVLFSRSVLRFDLLDFILNVQTCLIFIY